MRDVTITIKENGSYRVEGPVRLIGPDGSEIPTPDGKPIFLCRCGGSQNKPFCDSTHSKIGFLGALAAVEASQNDT